MHSQDHERLKHDHTELGELLTQLIATFDSSDIAQTHATLDLFWARLAMHIRAEHLHLFPTILHAVSHNAPNDVPSPAEAENIIEELRNDHDFFMRELSHSIALTREFLKHPQTAVQERWQDLRKSIDAVQERLISHNEVEENGIYVWTKTLLSEAEQTDLAAHIEKELQNLPPRFRVNANETSERS